MNSKWEVHVFLNAPEAYEISVLKSDNDHGHKSYGWDGPDKIIVSSSGGPCHNKIPERLYWSLIDCAQEYADYLNSINAQEAPAPMSGPNQSDAVTAAN